MAKDFSQLYKIIYENFMRLPEQKKSGDSRRAFAKWLGVSTGKAQAWEDKGQWPSAEDLETIHKKMGFSYQWLVTGEGKMLDSGEETSPLHKTDSPANVVTLGAKELGQENRAQTEKLEQRVAELERENAELTVELRGALKELRQLNEEKRELEERLKASPAFLESSENPEPATSPRPVTGALGGGLLGDFNKN